VQLDKTRIVIKERGMLEVMDLALQVLRSYTVNFASSRPDETREAAADASWLGHAGNEVAYLLGRLGFGPLAVAFLIGMAPFAAFNAWALAPFADPAYHEGVSGEYIWLMVLMVFFQAPLATCLATAYLGKAVFEESPSIGEVLNDAWAMFWQLVVCQLLIRVVLPAMVLVWLLEPGSRNNPIIHALLAFGAFYASIIRAVRPYINEIVLLEKSPLFSTDADTMTVNRRSDALHTSSFGVLIGRWIMTMFVAVIASLSLILGLFFLYAVTFSQWEFNAFALHFLIPGCLWMVAAYFAVVRFLFYLDLRIRREGWEVELRIRAEAGHMTRQLV